MTRSSPIVFLLLLSAGFGLQSAVAQVPKPGDPVKALRQDPKARAILDAAKAKLNVAKTLIADYEGPPYSSSTKDFERSTEIFLERPNRFRVEWIVGAITEERILAA